MCVCVGGGGGGMQMTIASRDLLKMGVVPVFLSYLGFASDKEL